MASGEAPARAKNGRFGVCRTVPRWWGKAAGLRNEAARRRVFSTSPCGVGDRGTGFCARDQRTISMQGFEGVPNG